MMLRDVHPFGGNVRLLALLLIAFAVFAAACSSTPTQESAGEYVSDAAITAKVKTAIMLDPKLTGADIRAETYKGVVALSGFVDSTEVAYRATAVVSAVRGVRSVRNNLIVKTRIRS
jgi:osmotically-inducible protein OsmY